MWFNFRFSAANDDDDLTASRTSSTTGLGRSPGKNATASAWTRPVNLWRPEKQANPLNEDEASDAGPQGRPTCCGDDSGPIVAPRPFRVAAISAGAAAMSASRARLPAKR